MLKALMLEKATKNTFLKIKKPIKGIKRPRETLEKRMGKAWTDTTKKLQNKNGPENE